MDHGVRLWKQHAFPFIPPPVPHDAGRPAGRTDHGPSSVQRGGPWARPSAVISARKRSSWFLHTRLTGTTGAASLPYFTLRSSELFLDTYVCNPSSPNAPQDCFPFLVQTPAPPRSKHTSQGGVAKGLWLLGSAHPGPCCPHLPSQSCSPQMKPEVFSQSPPHYALPHLTFPGSWLFRWPPTLPLGDRGTPIPGLWGWLNTQQQRQPEDMAGRLLVTYPHSVPPPWGHTGGALVTDWSPQVLRDRLCCTTG